MEIQRNYYLQKLIDRMNNGLIKIVTGIRRCGKSYLLFHLFHRYLVDTGVPESSIIGLSLDDSVHARYRNPFELEKFIREATADKSIKYYIFLDEIQFVKEVSNPWLDGPAEKIGFTDVLLGLMKMSNVDIYVTGSNSIMLSSDIITQFRDRGDEIRLYPLAYSEYCRAVGGDSENAWRDYYTYGGLPRVLGYTDRKDKIAYLQGLFDNTYLKDVLDRHDIRNNKEILDMMIRIVASGVGSLTNPKKISDTFQSVNKICVVSTTINLYLDYFIEAFLLSKAERFDIKGRKHIGAQLKYYFADIGLRNALLVFRQQEENHIMENIIFNELLIRGYSVDIGIVEYRQQDNNGKESRIQLEVDFIARSADTQIYIQSALNVDSEEKRKQEAGSLCRIGDSFKKMIVVRDNIMPWTDENGIRYVGVREFLSGKYDDMPMV